MATNPKRYGKHGFSVRLKNKAVREKEQGHARRDGKDFSPAELQMFMSMFLNRASYEQIGRRLGRVRDISADRIHKLIVGYSRLDRAFRGPLINRTGLVWTKEDEYVYDKWVRQRRLKEEGRTPEYAKAKMDLRRLCLLIGRFHTCKVLRKRLNQNKKAHNGFGL